MPRTKWLHGPIGATTTINGYVLAARKLGTAARPFRYRLYMFGSSWQFPQQGACRTLREAETMAKDYITSLSPACRPRSVVG